MVSFFWVVSVLALIPLFGVTDGAERTRPPPDLPLPPEPRTVIVSVMVWVVPSFPALSTALTVHPV